MRTNKHHVFTLEIDGVTEVTTMLSKNAQEINNSLAARMAMQCQLTIAEFWQMVDCTLSKEQWIEIIKNQKSSQLIS